jgi:ATP/maltotriose-dependent transcriptional regulator MalT
MPQLPAKVTRPRPSRAVPRRKPFARLDRVRQRGGAIWVSGQPGSGKTTLVASWVEARHAPTVWLRIDEGDADLASFFHHLALAARAASRRRMSLPALLPEYEDLGHFARRFFAKLYEKLPRGTVVVLDDCHSIPADAAFKGVLRAAVEELPDRAAIIFLSRAGPPPALARLRANGQLQAISGAELELTDAEAWAIARRSSYRGSRQRVGELRRTAKGWAAGFVLLLARAAGGGGGAHEVGETFDYFAGEVFDRADPATRRVLLEAALLDAPSAELVERVVGEGSGRILSKLAQHGLFTLRHEGETPAFEFHDLFRRFLLARGLEDLPPSRAAEVRRAAALALAERGGADAEAAIALLADAGAFEALAPLVVRQAGEAIRAGRSLTVAQWIDRIPADLQEADPWLLYWGGAAILPRDSVTAQARLERALQAFEARGDAAGVWMSWSATVEAILLGWADYSPLPRRLDELARFRARYPFPSRALEVRVMLSTLGAMVHHAPGHPALPTLAEAAKALALDQVDDRVRLAAGAHYVWYAAWWHGDPELARPVVEALRGVARAPSADPAMAIMWLSVEAPLLAIMGDAVAAQKTVADALRISEASGVHAWGVPLHLQSIWHALASDDDAAAQAHLARMAASVRPGNPIDLALLRTLEGCAASQRDDLARAATLASEGESLSRATGRVITTIMARMLLARTSPRLGGGLAADAALATLREAVAGVGTSCFRRLLALIEADLRVRAGDPEGALAPLAQAMSLGRLGVTHTAYLFSGAELAQLCALALDRGLQVSSTQDFIRARALTPPREAGSSWPWALRIHALGRFEVVRDGVAFEPAPRAPRKPMELLALLVASGGRGVEASTIADALWPHSEADAAHHALETTVYRLRRIVGPDVVVQRDQRLSLAADRCWVDVYELEARLSDGIAALERGGTEPGGPTHAERIAALYRGPLLADERDSPWGANARERVRRKLARWLHALGGAGSPGEAAALRATLAGVDPALAPALRLVV